MKKYTYSPPKVKTSTRLTNVVDDDGKVVCMFQRVYASHFTRIADLFLGFNFYVEFNVFSSDGTLLFRGKKIPRWGKTHYQVINCQTNEQYHVTYKSWQTLAPEFHIVLNSGEYIVKKELMDWARFYCHGEEIARWKMKTTEFFTTYLELEDSSPIREPAFFVCLFQCIFYIGD